MTGPGTSERNTLHNQAIVMREQLEKRLAELKGEFAAGQKQLNELEAQASALRGTLLRIAGAVQVLEEELDRAPAQTRDGRALYRTDTGTAVRHIRT